VRAELAKFRYLPLPRWTALAVIGVMLIAGIVLLAVAPDDASWYEQAPGLALTLGFSVAAIVLGVWSATIEFSSGTLQRTLTAEPGRSKVLASKLLVAIAASAAIGIAATLTGLAISDLAAQRASVEIDRGEVSQHLFASLPAGILGTVVGFGFGVLTRSMGGGIALGLALIFIADGMLQGIPGVGEFTYGQVTGDVTNELAGEGDTKNSLGLALAASLAWGLALTLPGWLRFTRGDLK
jgi:ABC-2 type transport system permease protein